MNDVLTIHTIDALEVHLARAGIGSRAYAFLIDWHIRAVAALAWFLTVVYALGIGLQQGLAAMSWWALVPASLIYLLYHPVLEVLMHGQTPGKRWIHLRIVTADGAVPGAGALILRNVFRLLDSLPILYAVGLLVMFVTRDQVRIGDLAAGTLVVYDTAATADGLTRAAVHERIPAGVAQLLEEWLERWGQIAPGQRDAIARAALAKVPGGDPAAAGELEGVKLREHVRALLQ